MKQKIAIIEDELMIADMYKFKLEQSGYEVRCASNGKEGLQLVEVFLPDITLLDLMMPEMSGDEMLAKVRATDWGKDLTVIILTNVTEGMVTDKLAPLHVEQYIIKANYTPAQLVEVVAQVLKNKETPK